MKPQSNINQDLNLRQPNQAPNQRRNSRDQVQSQKRSQVQSQKQNQAQSQKLWHLSQKNLRRNWMRTRKVTPILKRMIVAFLISHPISLQIKRPGFLVVRNQPIGNPPIGLIPTCHGKTKTTFVKDQGNLFRGIDNKTFRR